MSAVLMKLVFRHCVNGSIKPHLVFQKTTGLNKTDGHERSDIFACVVSVVYGCVYAT